MKKSNKKDEIKIDELANVILLEDKVVKDFIDNVITGMFYINVYVFMKKSALILIKIIRNGNGMR